MGFVDTHVHLHFPDFDADRGEVLDRARTRGFDFFVNVGTDMESSRRSLELATAHQDVFAAAGIHPHDAKDAGDEDFKILEELLKHPRMVAIGEVGLDFFRDHSPRDVQQKVLRRFLEIYDRIQKPLILHCRDAYEDLRSLLQSHAKLTYRGVMHCFSSDRETMFRFLDLGFFISFAAPLTYKKNDALREACRVCPGDRLLFETDAPFLPPQSRRGQRNESSYMLETLGLAAKIRGVSPEDLGAQTTVNAKELFKIADVS